MPKISVVLPVYNVKRYLARCLDSLLSQTFTDFEAICVDDGSTDTCPEILKAYSEKDSRVRVVRQENRGLSMARNTGMRYVSAPYLFFLDSDDAIHPQCLELTYALAQKYDASLVSFLFRKSTGEGAPPSERYQLEKLSYRVTDRPVFSGFRKKRYHIPLTAWSKLYRRDVIGDYRFIPGIHYEDYPFVFSLLASSPRTVAMRTPLYLYTNNDTSITHQKQTPGQLEDYRKGLEFVLDVYSKPGLEKERKYLLRHLLPNIMKQQLNKCLRADPDIQPQMFETFTRQLQAFDARGVLSWRGHKLSRYLTYRRLLREAKRQK